MFLVFTFEDCKLSSSSIPSLPHSMLRVKLNNYFYSHNSNSWCNAFYKIIHDKGLHIQSCSFSCRLIGLHIKREDLIDEHS